MNPCDSQIIKKSNDKSPNISKKEIVETVTRKVSETNLAYKQVPIVFFILSEIFKKHNITIDGISASPSTIARRMNKKALLFHQECVDIMKNSIGIALSFDETKIKKTTEYLAVCCRALRNNFTLHEFIYVLDSVPSTKGNVVAQKIMSNLKYDGVDNIRLFGLTSDGASSCLGNQKGASTIVSKQHSPEDNIPIIHCYVHRLNLVLKSLSNDDNHDYFTSITDYLIGVCILISKDIHHVGMKADFKNYLKSLNTKIKMIPQYCSTRWSVVANILDYVVEHLNILQDYFESTEYSHYIYALTFFQKGFGIHI